MKWKLGIMKFAYSILLSFMAILSLNILFNHIIWVDLIICIVVCFPIYHSTVDKLFNDNGVKG